MSTDSTATARQGGPLKRISCPRCGKDVAKRVDGMPWAHDCQASDEHVGYFERRTWSEHALLERAFAEQWRAENDQGYHEHRPRSLPDMLMKNMPGFELPLTRRERRLVATMIQWLGSNVGFCFLQEALGRDGYRIEQ